MDSPLPGALVCGMRAVGGIEELGVDEVKWGIRKEFG